MTLRPLFAALFTTLVLAAAPFDLLAQEIDPASPAPLFEGRWWTMPRVIALLNLSPEQTKRIDEIQYQANGRTIDFKASLEKARLDVARLLQSDAIDDAALDRTVERLVQAQAAIYREETARRIEIARVLTREQRVLVMTWFERRQGTGWRQNRLRR